MYIIAHGVPVYRCNYLYLFAGNVIVCFCVQVKSLRVVLMSQSNSESFVIGNKRRLYMLLVIALTQPLLMWWLTRRLVV